VTDTPGTINVRYRVSGSHRESGEAGQNSRSTSVRHIVAYVARCGWYSQFKPTAHRERSIRRLRGRKPVPLACPTQACGIRLRWLLVNARPLHLRSHQFPPTIFRCRPATLANSP